MGLTDIETHWQELLTDICTNGGDASVPPDIKQIINKNTNLKQYEDILLVWFQTWVYRYLAKINSGDVDIKLNEDDFVTDMTTNGFFENMQEVLCAETARQYNVTSETQYRQHMIDLILFCMRCEVTLQKIYVSNQYLNIRDDFEESLRTQEAYQVEMTNAIEKAESELKGIVQQRITEIQTHTEKIKQTMQQQIDDESKKAAETSMTVLGIFVGVVMVFFGGFTILENAITGMATASPYRLAFTMLLFGAILFDVVVMLFYLIGKLTNKPITCECYEYTAKKDVQNGLKNCSNCARCRRSKTICRVRHITPYVFWGNAVVLTLLLFVFCMYAFRGLDMNMPEQLQDVGHGALFSKRPDEYTGLTITQVVLATAVASLFAVLVYRVGLPLSDAELNGVRAVKNSTESTAESTATSVENSTATVTTTATTTETETPVEDDKLTAESVAETE